MDLLERTLMTIGCPDATVIPKVPDAGRILETAQGPVQVMHNGLRVVAGGYHGDWMAHIIRSLRGHHEPQEELLFDALLRVCRHNSVIVELGSFWAYYSLWYLKEIPGSRAICVEPDKNNLSVGIKNAELNNFSNEIQFHSAWVGREYLRECTSYIESTQEKLTLPCYDMEELLKLLSEEEIVEILHMDVQGAEFPFLQSMSSAVAQDKVRFAVISTHHSSISGSTKTHSDCIEAITSLGGKVLVEHDVQESFSGDGLIVASFFHQDRHLELPTISRNSARRSLFPER